MLDIGFFIWKLSAMPTDPLQLVNICKVYGIKRLAIKVLDGKWSYNVPSGDRKLMDYMYVLRAHGIVVEGWGYHYPDQPGAQGDAIEERREKLGFETYHVNAEQEWKQPYGMPRAAELLLGKPKVNRFEMLLCSYRYMSLHAPFPFKAFMTHETIDGASPQVYWALAHNAEEQLVDCLDEYSVWGKPIYPIGPTFGSNFTINGVTTYWEPTVEELVAFREFCVASGINRMYFYSLDWLLANKRYDWLVAATGVDVEIPPVPIPEEKFWIITNCTWLNGRSEPTSSVDNRIITVKAGQKVENLDADSGSWKYVGLGPIKFWMHGDYLEPTS